MYRVLHANEGFGGYDATQMPMNHPTMYRTCGRTNRGPASAGNGKRSVRAIRVRDAPATGKPVS